MVCWVFLLVASFQGQLSLAYSCWDGCVISDGYINDDFCDCSQCEDENTWTCAMCTCPTVCGQYNECDGEEPTVEPTIPVLPTTTPGPTVPLGGCSYVQTTDAGLDRNFAVPMGVCFYSALYQTWVKYDVAYDYTHYFYRRTYFHPSDTSEEVCTSLISTVTVYTFDIIVNNGETECNDRSVIVARMNGDAVGQCPVTDVLDLIEASSDEVYSEQPVYLDACHYNYSALDGYSKTQFEEVEETPSHGFLDIYGGYDSECEFGNLYADNTISPHCASYETYTDVFKPSARPRDLSTPEPVATTNVPLDYNGIPQYYGIWENAQCGTSAISASTSAYSGYFYMDTVNNWGEMCEDCALVFTVEITSPNGPINLEEDLDVYLSRTADSYITYDTPDGGSSTSNYLQAHVWLDSEDCNNDYDSGDTSSYEYKYYFMDVASKSEACLSQGPQCSATSPKWKMALSNGRRDDDSVWDLNLLTTDDSYDGYFQATFQYYPSSHSRSISVRYCIQVVDLSVSYYDLDICDGNKDGDSDKDKKSGNLNSTTIAIIAGSIGGVIFLCSLCARCRRKSKSSAAPASYNSNQYVSRPVPAARTQMAAASAPVDVWGSDAAASGGGGIYGNMYGAQAIGGGVPQASAPALTYDALPRKVTHDKDFLPTYAQMGEMPNYDHVQAYEVPPPAYTR